VSAAAEGGVEAFVGGMFELGIGRAAAAAVATLPGCTVPTDLGPSRRYVERDVCEPVVTDGTGLLVVPEGAGIGRVPDAARLAEVTVDQVVLGR
jgi:O-succinylbenzoate synthase